MVPPKAAPPKKNVIKSIGRLDTPYEVRRVCARLSNHLLRKEITPQQATAIRGLLDVCLRTIDMGDFSDKLSELERSIRKMKKKRR